MPDLPARFAGIILAFVPLSPSTAGAAVALTPAQLARLLEGIDWRGPLRTDRSKIGG
ncbi:hypothetical protein ACQVP2_25630 [Methylobacterium aquaticum]|uniref:hypothetical protein n=1 Tax=Methylobacterium aquaticum TaxID=270351 RepID=UPI003D17300B